MSEEKIVYINMDRSLIKKGGRNAAKISEKELFRKVYAMQKANEPDGLAMEPIEDFTLDMVNVDELTGNVQISKDLSKIKFDAENCIADPDEWDEESLIGIHTLPNGLTFIGMAVGGDWEQPLFLIIYWSGRALRGYIPSYGNTFNPDFKAAFGSEGSNKSVDNNKVFANAPYNGCDVHEAGPVYLKSLAPDGEDTEGIRADMNWKAIEEDIMSRIEIA